MVLYPFKARGIGLCGSNTKAPVHLSGIDTDNFGIETFRKCKRQARFADSCRTDQGK